MLSGERAFDSGEAAAAGVDFQIADLEIGGAFYGDAQLGGLGVEHCLRVGSLAGEYRRDAGLQDAGFFGGDGFDSVAQENLVIHVDGSDHCERRVDDVGRIEAPA